jgi:hypothetical protein
MSSLWHPTRGRGTLYSPEGDILWQDPDWIENTLVDEGEQSVLEVYFREQANPTKYLALINQATPAETDTMASLTESKSPGTGGYSRQQILGTDWGATALNAGDMQTTAAAKTFGPIATSALTATHIVLTTTATGTGGKFLLYIALSATTVIAAGQSFVYTLSTKAQ